MPLKSLDPSELPERAKLPYKFPEEEIDQAIEILKMGMYVTSGKTFSNSGDARRHALALRLRILATGVKFEGGLELLTSTWPDESGDYYHWALALHDPAAEMTRADT